MTADGRLLRVDSENEPDLFWALRGSGGGFAIVTALELELQPVRELYAGDFFWPMERAGEILAAWRAWAAGVPNTVTSVGRLLSLPPLPQIPEPFRGRSFVMVEAACIATQSEGIELTRPLRSLGPEMDTFATMPPTGLAALHMDPPDPSPAVLDGAMLTEFPAAAIEALLSVAGAGSGSPLLSVELRQLGGALGVDAPGCGALGHLEAELALGIVSMAVDEAMAAGAYRHISLVKSALARWTAPRNYLNFAEHAPLSEILPPETCARLARIKAVYDPDDRIVSGHPVGG